MKKLILIPIVLLMAFSFDGMAQQKKKKSSSHGTKKGVKSSGPQMFVDFGLKGLVGTGAFMNSYLFADDNYQHKLAVNYGYGGKFGFDFNPSFEILGEAIFNKTTQKFTVNGDLYAEAWDKTINLKTLDVPILMRFNTPETGAYVEFGPQISMVKGSTESIYNGTAQVPANYFNANYWSAVFGFGGYAMGWENFGISTGIRLSYAFQDIVNNSNFSSITPNDTYLGNVNSYESYKGTNPLSIFFVLEFNYDLGFILAKNSCTGRRKFILYN
jgi:hypothetical protein